MPGERRINPQNPPRTLFGRKKKKIRSRDERAPAARRKGTAATTNMEAMAPSEGNQESS